MRGRTNADGGGRGGVVRGRDGGRSGRRVDGLGAFTTPVRGHAFAAPPPGCRDLPVGGRARLRREPANPADPLAVAVWMEQPRQPGWRIGYLDRAVAARLAPRLDRGLRLDARLEGWLAEPEGRWRRPALRLEPVDDDADPGLGRDGVRPPGVRVRRLTTGSTTRQGQRPRAPAA